MEQPLTALAGEEGLRVRFAFGASGMLARQIRQGAPYDVYLSANESFVTDLEASGYLRRSTLRIYAFGRVGLWSKSGNIRALADLLRPEVKHLAMPNPDHAPYGVAAREILRSQGLWGTLEPKIVYGENVQQAFQYAESGNADAALTAWSLVMNRNGVLLPAAWHAPVRQAGAVVAASPHGGAGLRFLELLSSHRGRELMARHGLTPPQ